MKNHIFIAYSRKDHEYVQRLAHELRKRKFVVWMDDRINFGSRWWKVIEDAIFESKAVVVVMSTHSLLSKFVEKEYMLADDAKKPIFPLLLSGQRFPYFVNMQWIDVTGGQIPSQNFFDQLMQVRSKVKIDDTDNDGDLIISARLDKVIIEVEKMALSYVMMSPTGLSYTIRTWVGSTDQIYKCPLIQSLKKLALVDLINDLQKRYVTKKTYDDKAPTLLILLGLLDGQLPYPPSERMTDEMLDENVKYLRKIGVTEIASLTEIVVFLNAVYNDCYI